MVDLWNILSVILQSLSGSQQSVNYILTTELIDLLAFSTPTVDR